MIHKITLPNHKQFILLLCLLISIVVNAQIGIGTTTPNTSSILDITSNTKGMLAPRMTTAERIAISGAAESLLVFDTTEKAFYFYNTANTTWVKLANESSVKRNNYKLIKSVADLAAELTAGGAAKYLLDSSTLYEINGTINLNFPIDLNNAYIQGLDSGEDKIVSAGDIFQGSKGGGIKSLTLSSTGGKVFNLTGIGTGNTENLIFRDCIVVNSSSVGSINKFGLVFLSIIQFSGNTTGIEYSNISQLLLSNLGWFGNNMGTFEKLTGKFGLVQKQGGFTQVEAGSTGFDVSSNPTISGDAVLESVVFTGLNKGGYVKPYTNVIYPNSSFSDSWTVDSPGIPRESDAAATANLYKNNRDFVTTSATSALTGYKVGTTSTLATNLFRFTSPQVGRLTYKGNKKRAFQVNATISYEASTSNIITDYVFYFVRIDSNGVTALPETETYTDTKTNSIISTIGVTGTVVLAKDESVELYLQRVSASGNTKIEVVSYNLSLK